MQDTQVQSLSLEDPLEKEMATHSSILAWKIPCTEEAGVLQRHSLSKEQFHFQTFLVTLLLNITYTNIL